MKKILAVILVLAFLLGFNKLLKYHQELEPDPIQNLVGRLETNIPLGSFCCKTNLQDGNRIYYYLSFLLAPRVLLLKSSQTAPCKSIIEYNKVDEPAIVTDSIFATVFSDTSGGYSFTYYQNSKLK